VRERKGGGTHLSAYGVVVLPAEPRGAEPRDVVALTGFLGVEIRTTVWRSDAHLSR
jgi:hypothetical protein